MLIKSADDKTKRLALLEDLQQSPLLDLRQKGWLRDELRRCKTFSYEQSRRHARILGKLLERPEISTHTDKLPEFHNVVMVHPKAIIQRPAPKAFETSFLIKADQFPTWHEKLGESASTGGEFKALLNVRSMDTIKESGEKLKREHRPADLLILPDFMRHKAASAAERSVVPAAPVVSAPAQVTKPTQPAEAAAQPAPAVADESIAKKLIYAHCRAKISHPEDKFCWNNTKRFGGFQYCRDHLGLFA